MKEPKSKQELSPPIAARAREWGMVTRKKNGGFKRSSMYRREDMGDMGTLVGVEPIPPFPMGTSAPLKG